MYGVVASAAPADSVVERVVLVDLQVWVGACQQCMVGDMILGVD
jgi:hypothetical protein